MPLYTMPMFGQITETFSSAESSTSGEGMRFSVAMTIALEAVGRGVRGSKRASVFC